MAPTEGKRRGTDLEHATGASELARPKQTSPSCSAPRIQCPDREGRVRSESAGVRRESWVPAIRCVDVLGPAYLPLRGDRDDGLLHGVEHGRQLVTSAFDFCEVLTKAFRGLVRGALHRRKFVEEPETSRRALRSPCAMRRAKATTRCRRPVSSTGGSHAGG